MLRKEISIKDLQEISKLIFECEEYLEHRMLTLKKEHTFMQMYAYTKVNLYVSELLTMLDKPHDEILIYFEIFLARSNQEIIDTTYLSYNKFSNHVLAKLCYKIACVLESAYSETEKNAYQYLIPSLASCDNLVTLENLSALRLDQFVLCEKGQYGLPLTILDDYIQAGEETRKKTLWNPYIEIKKDKDGTPISDVAFQNLIIHSTESAEYYKAYQNYLAADKSRLEKALRELSAGLRKGGAYDGGTGTAENAGKEAVQALVKFESFLDSLDRGLRKNVEALVSSYNGKTIRQILDQMIGYNQGDLTCVVVGANAIDFILHNPENTNLLSTYEAELAQVILIQTRDIFLEAYDGKTRKFKTNLYTHGECNYPCIEHIILHLSKMLELNGNIPDFLITPEIEIKLITTAVELSFKQSNVSLAKNVIEFTRKNVFHKDENKILELLSKYLPMPGKKTSEEKIAEILYYCAYFSLYPLALNPAKKIAVLIIDIIKTYPNKNLDRRMLAAMVEIAASDDKHMPNFLEFCARQKSAERIYVFITQIFQNKKFMRSIKLVELEKFFDLLINAGGNMEKDTDKVNGHPFFNDAILQGRVDIAKMMKLRGLHPSLLDISLIQATLLSQLQNEASFEIFHAASIVTIEPFENLITHILQKCDHFLAKTAIASGLKFQYKHIETLINTTPALDQARLLRFLFEINHDQINELLEIYLKSLKIDALFFKIRNLFNSIELKNMTLDGIKTLLSMLANGNHQIDEKYATALFLHAVQFGTEDILNLILSRYQPDTAQINKACLIAARFKKYQILEFFFKNNLLDHEQIEPLLNYSIRTGRLDIIYFLFNQMTLDEQTLLTACQIFNILDLHQYYEFLSIKIANNKLLVPLEQRRSGEIKEVEIAPSVTHSKMIDYFITRKSSIDTADNNYIDLCKHIHSLGGCLKLDKPISDILIILISLEKTTYGLSKFEDTLILHAAKNGDLALMKGIIQANLNIKVIVDGNYALDIAIKDKNIVMAKLLLQNGAVAGKGLLIAATHFGDIELIKYLIAAGANINEIENGNTALMIAVKLQNRELVELLLKHQANPNISDDTSINSKIVTPLWCLPKGADIEISRLLLQYGANVLTKNNNGKTVLEQFSDSDAYYPERRAIYRLYSSVSLIENLLQKLGEETDQYRFIDQAKIKFFESKINYRSREEKMMALNALNKAVVKFSDTNNTFAKFDQNYLAIFNANSDIKKVYESICRKFGVEIEHVNGNSKVMK